MDRPIISMLVADTFFDKLLGHGVDGVDIASLDKVKEEANACNEEAEDDDLSIILNENDFDVSTNNRKPTEKHKGIKRKPATSTAETRSWSRHGSAAKYIMRNILDMDIEKFGDKLWRKSGVNMSDFFNYGLDEKQWMAYRSKLKKALVRVQSSRRIKSTANESIQPYKEGAIAGVGFGRGSHEQHVHLFLDLKDSSICFNDSDVIIEIVKEEHMKEEGELSDGEGDATQHMMINGDNILPFPMDS